RKVERSGKRVVIAENQICLALLTGRGGQPVVVAFLRDDDTLRREILATTLGALESPTIIAVLDREGRTVYSRAPIGDAPRVLSVQFRDALPDWRLAVYQTPGASPRQAVRRQVMFFTGALGALVAVIVAGSVATWRLMRRETEMARLKSDFVANVSHDLKTPLSVIRMFGETLEMGRVTDEGRRQEYYRVITREGERLTRLIDNVLDFSRIEGGRQTYRMTPTSVEPLVRRTLETFAYPLAQQGFKVEVSVAPDLPEVAMDADAVGQALAKDRKSTRLNSSHVSISYAVFCLKKKKLELDRLELCRFERLRRRPGASLAVEHLSLPDQGEADVGKGRQIAAAADRTEPRHQRRDALVEHRDQSLGQHRAHARQPHRQGARAEKHGRAHDLLVHRWSNAGCMRSDEGELELGLPERRDACACERSETGRHSIYGLARCGGSLDAFAAALHPRPRRGREGDLLSVTGHGDDL